jgi:hypothetical protein
MAERYEDALARVGAEVDAHMDNVVERAEASGCYRADTCVMDCACPFIDNCRMVEANG